MGKGQEKGYWDKRVLKDKARDVNNAEKFLQKNQKVLYAQAAKEIQQEIEKLYGKFTDQQDISIAEARRLIRGADFKKIDWQGMIRESMELREKIREGKGMLPEEVIEALEKQHKELEDRMAAYTKRGQISYLELRQAEIERKLLDLYDKNQQNLYEYLHSEYEDGYYRQVYNTQQHVGFGYDFVKPSGEAVDRAILNRYDRRNFSKTLYQHCDHFAKDIRENLVVGLIRGESLERMAARIRDRMGVAYSAAKRLVRTETAYIYEQATKDAYEECGVEWYEFLATLDGRTSEACRELDGKHFKVKDAMPGKNYPPMHPNCRSTTVVWFPGEEEKKRTTSRIAKDGAGKYYEVPADMTYKQWAKKHSDGQALMTYEEKRALNQYISFEAYTINDALRNNRKLTVREDTLVKQLDGALDKLTDYQGTVIRCLDIADLDTFLENYQIGGEIIYEEYTSCSTEEGYNPTANVMIYRKSTKGKDLTGLNTAEKEVLYKRGSKFKVENIVEQDGVIFIMEVEA